MDHNRINGETLAKPNYQYEKRQRDLAKKKKKEEKRQRKLEKSQVSQQGGDEKPPIEDTENG